MASGSFRIARTAQLSLASVGADGEAPGGPHVLRILEREVRHEICMMDDVGFCRPLYKISLSRVRGNDVANIVGNSAFERERDAGEWMTQGLSPLALLALPVRSYFVLQQFTHIGKNGPCNHHIEVDWQRAAHKFLHCLRTLPGNVHHAALVLHEGDGAIRDQQGERDTIQVVRLERTAFESLDPRLCDLISQPGVFNPTNLRPKFFDSRTHEPRLPVQTHKLTVTAEARREMYDREF